MNIYKVSPPVWLLTKTKDGEKVSVIKGKKDGAKKNEFDILNWNFYDKKGNVVRVPSQNYQDEKFIERLVGISPVEKVETFLKYQYKHSENKELFLEHLISETIVSKLKNHIEQRKILIEWVNKKLDLIGSEEQTKKETKNADKLSHRQQILTLHSIGFFELPTVKNIGAKQKGILVSHILNRTEKDSEDLIRYFDGRKKERRFECKTPDNIKVVKELLSKIGRGDIEIK